MCDYSAARAIVGVDPVEQHQLPLDDKVGHARHRGGDVDEEALLLACVEQVEQRARLAEIVLAGTVVIARGVA